MDSSSISSISPTPESRSSYSGEPRSSAEAAKNAGGRPLNQEEQQQVTKLKRRDTEVRAHESAHVAAGGAYVRGGPNYEYQTGPDGKQYAAGGEVAIDSSPVSGNPQATITKMQVVRRAALAPANPSGQDQAVAAQAGAAEAKARQEIAKQRLSQSSNAPGVKVPDSGTKPNGGPPRLSESAASAYTRNSVFADTKKSAFPSNSLVDIIG